MHGGKPLVHPLKRENKDDSLLLLMALLFYAFLFPGDTVVSSFFSYLARIRVAIILKRQSLSATLALEYVLTHKWP